MFEEEQVGDLLDIVTVGITLIAQVMGVFPDFLDQGLVVVLVCGLDYIMPSTALSFCSNTAISEPSRLPSGPSRIHE